MIYRLYINLPVRNQPPSQFVPIDEKTIEEVEETMADFNKCGRTSRGGLKISGSCSLIIEDSVLEQTICRTSSKQRAARRVPTHVCRLPYGGRCQGLRRRGQPHRQKQGLLVLSFRYVMRT